MEQIYIFLPHIPQLDGGPPNLCAWELLWEVLVYRLRFNLKAAARRFLHITRSSRVPHKKRNKKKKVWRTGATQPRSNVLRSARRVSSDSGHGSPFDVLLLKAAFV